MTQVKEKEALRESVSLAKKQRCISFLQHLFEINSQGINRKNNLSNQRLFNNNSTTSLLDFWLFFQKKL